MIKDIRYVVRRCRRCRWAHAPAIHTASHVHACDPVPIVMVLRYEPFHINLRWKT